MRVIKHIFTDRGSAGELGVVEGGAEVAKKRAGGRELFSH